MRIFFCILLLLIATTGSRKSDNHFDEYQGKEVRVGKRYLPEDLWRDESGYKGNDYLEEALGDSDDSEEGIADLDDLTDSDEYNLGLYAGDDKDILQSLGVDTSDIEVGEEAVGIEFTLGQHDALFNNEPEVYALGDFLDNDSSDESSDSEEMVGDYTPPEVGKEDDGFVDEESDLEMQVGTEYVENDEIPDYLFEDSDELVDFLLDSSDDEVAVGDEFNLDDVTVGEEMFGKELDEFGALFIDDSSSDSEEEVGGWQSDDEDEFVESDDYDETELGGTWDGEVAEFDSADVDDLIDTILDSSSEEEVGDFWDEEPVGEVLEYDDDFDSDEEDLVGSGAPPEFFRHYKEAAVGDDDGLDGQVFEIENTPDYIFDEDSEEGEVASQEDSQDYADESDSEEDSEEADSDSDEDSLSDSDESDEDSLSDSNESDEDSLSDSDDEDKVGIHADLVNSIWNSVAAKEDSLSNPNEYDENYESDSDDSEVSDSSDVSEDSDDYSESDSDEEVGYDSDDSEDSEETGYDEEALGEFFEFDDDDLDDLENFDEFSELLNYPDDDLNRLRRYRRRLYLADLDLSAEASNAYDATAPTTASRMIESPSFQSGNLQMQQNIQATENQLKAATELERVHKMQEANAAIRSKVRNALAQPTITNPAAAGYTIAQKIAASKQLHANNIQEVQQQQQKDRLKHDIIEHRLKKVHGQPGYEKEEHILKNRLKGVRKKLNSYRAEIRGQQRQHARFEQFQQKMQRRMKHQAQVTELTREAMARQQREIKKLREEEEARANAFDLEKRKIEADATITNLKNEIAAKMSAKKEQNEKKQLEETKRKMAEGQPLEADDTTAALQKAKDAAMQKEIDAAREDAEQRKQKDEDLRKSLLKDIQDRRTKTKALLAKAHREEKDNEEKARVEANDRYNRMQERLQYKDEDHEFHLNRLRTQFPYIDHFFGDVSQLRDECGVAKCDCGFYKLHWVYKEGCYMVKGQCQECSADRTKKIKAIGFTYKFVDAVQKQLPIFTYRRKGKQWHNEPKSKSVCPPGQVVTAVKTQVLKQVKKHKHSMRIKCGTGDGKSLTQAAKERLETQKKAEDDKAEKNGIDITPDAINTKDSTDAKDTPADSNTCPSKGATCECGFLKLEFQEQDDNCFIPVGECNECGSPNIKSAVQGVGFDYVHNDERKKELPKFAIRKRGAEWNPEPMKQFQCRDGYVVNGVWTSAEKNTWGESEDGKKNKRDQYFLSITCRKMKYAGAPTTTTTTTAKPLTTKEGGEESGDDKEDGEESDDDKEDGAEGGESEDAKSDGEEEPPTTGPLSQHECPPAVSECKCGFASVDWEKTDGCYQLKGECLDCGTPGAVIAIGYNYEFDKSRKKSIYRWRYKSDGKLWIQPERRYSCRAGKIVTNIATSAVRAGDEVKYHLWMKCNDKVATTPKVPLHGMFAWYKYKGLEKDSWKSSVGDFEMQVLGGKYDIKTDRGDGAREGVAQLQGTTETQLDFGRIIPKEYTVCTLSRYTQDEGQKRVLIGSAGTWLHGHWNGKAGVALYGDWKTRKENRVEPNTNWLYMCGQNAQRSIIRANGVSVKSSNDGLNGPMNMMVNKGGCCELETSNFGVAEIITWDRYLSFTEMLHVEAYFERILEEGNLQQKTEEDDTKKADDAAKTDDKKTDAAKTDDKKTDAAKTDDKKTDAAKTDDKKTDAAKTDDKKTDAAKTDDKKTDAAKTDGNKDLEALVAGTPWNSETSVGNSIHHTGTLEKTESDLVRVGIQNEGEEKKILFAGLLLVGLSVSLFVCYDSRRDKGDTLDAFYATLPELDALE